MRLPYPAPCGKRRPHCAKGLGPTAQKRCRSSVVEHSLGKGEVESSILSGSTICPIDFSKVSAFVGLFSAPLLHRAATQMVLRMARPAKRKGTANHQYRKRIPPDVQKRLQNLPAAYRPSGWGKTEIVISTKTADARKAKAEHARISAEVEAYIERLRSKVQSLSQKQATALSGKIYRAFAEALEDNPGETKRWSKVLLDNAKARSGKYSDAPLLIGKEAKRAAAMEKRFGAIVDAALAKEGLIIDRPSRDLVMEAFSLALDQAALKLKKNAEGDYRPDEIANRFPDWSHPTTGTAAKKLSLLALFNQWAKHPEQREQAPKTISRYKGVFERFDQFTRQKDANEITIMEVRTFVDSLMTEQNISPRTARDVYKAALSSIFAWAAGKGIVSHNPAAEVQIKVKKSIAVRPKELTDQETTALVSACLSIRGNVPRTSEAARRWSPLICLYTGARIGEVTQLRSEDFKREGNLHFIKITPEAGSVKDREYRLVPLHPRLSELGLLTLVEAAAGPLFYDPQAKRRKKNAATTLSEMVASDVAAWARATSLNDPNLKKPLHALRHRFTTLARNAGIDPQYIEAITGHAPTGQNSRYGSFDVGTLMREICKLDVERVEATHRK